MSGSESQLQRTCRELVQHEGGYVVTLNPTNGTNEPDLTGTVAGWSFAVELKKPGEDPRPGQRTILRLWSQAGAVTAVVRSTADMRWVVTECRRRSDASLGSPRRIVGSGPAPEQEPLR